MALLTMALLTMAASPRASSWSRRRRWRSRSTPTTSRCDPSPPLYLLQPARALHAPWQPLAALRAPDTAPPYVESTASCVSRTKSICHPATQSPQSPQLRQSPQSPQSPISSQVESVVPHPARIRAVAENVATAVVLAAQAAAGVATPSLLHAYTTESAQLATLLPLYYICVHY